MIANYITLSLRLLARTPLFTFINILGLSLGFAVFIILWQYSQNELHSDRFHKDHERTYRILTDIDAIYDKTQVHLTCGFDTPIHGLSLSEKLPQVESLTRIYNQDNFNSAWIDDHSSHLFFTVAAVSGDENHFTDDHVAYADPNMFQFFGINLTDGNPAHVLSQPNAVAISSKIAKKYFGSANPIDKVIMLNNTIPLKVTGVFADLPENSHMEFEIVLSMLRLERNIKDFKIAAKGAPISYLKLKHGVTVASLKEMLEEDSRELTRALRQKSETGDLKARTSLQPLAEIAFSNFEGDHFVPKSKVFLVIQNSIAVIVLIVAWINYINLTLCSNIKRSRELATRKTIGARPIDLVKQFVVESATINLLSLCAALTIIQLTKPILASSFQFFVYDISSAGFNTSWIVAFTLVFGIFITALYPALSSLKTNRSASSGQNYGAHGKTTNALMIGQYTCALVLIIGAFAIQRQLGYILSHSIGINREGIVVLDLPVRKEANFRTQLEKFRNEVNGLSFVEALTISNNVVGDREEHGVYIAKPGQPEIGAVPDCNGGVDEHFLSTYNIQLLAGRNFLPDHPADTAALLISRQAAKNLHYDVPEDIIGQILLVQEEDYSKVFTRAEVIGVFEDYKRTPLFSSHRSARKGDDIGILLTYGDYMVPAQEPRKISMRISTNDLDQALKLIERKYKEVFPGNAFNWSMLNDNINKYYVNEKIARNQIVLFSALVVVIACLGLFGMIMQRVLLKTKEIGIRKVLGAKMRDIGEILLNATIRQIVISIMIAVPMSWYVVQQYLERFSDRLQPQWWHYAMPVFLLLVILFASVAILIFKASRTNPVEALRSE
jgi:putative ABC transport system permease protein